jgi:hypothetical protein
LFREAPDIVRARMVERWRYDLSPDVPGCAALDGQLAKRPAVVLAAPGPFQPRGDSGIEMGWIATLGAYQRVECRQRNGTAP